MCVCRVLGAHRFYGHLLPVLSFFMQLERFQRALHGYAKHSAAYAIVKTQLTIEKDIYMKDVIRLASTQVLSHIELMCSLTVIILRNEFRRMCIIEPLCRLIFWDFVGKV